MFSEILQKTRNISSMIELGANVGFNLKAIKNILPDIEFSAVEINHKAAEILKQDKDLNVTVYEESILEFCKENVYDLVLCKGVLIHLNPDSLDNVYEKIYNASRKYFICRIL